MSEENAEERVRWGLMIFYVDLLQKAAEIQRRKREIKGILTE